MSVLYRAHLCMKCSFGISDYGMLLTMLFAFKAVAAGKLLQSCPTLRPQRRQPNRLPRP